MKSINQNFVLLVLSVFLCTACNYTKEKTETKVETINVKPIILTDSLFTRFPGSFILTQDYLVWSDPFTADNFLKIVDIKTGNQLVETGTVGQGPKEFNTPQTYYMEGNKLLIIDINSQKQALLSIDSLLTGNEGYIYGKGVTLTDATSVLIPDENTFIGLFPQEDIPFKCISSEEVVSFGKYPITKKISNGFDCFQGDLAYNKKKEVMVYSPYDFPSLYLYKKNKNSFDLKFEKVLYNPEYSIVDGELRMKYKVILISAIAMTKNYIVALQEKEYDKNAKQGRDSPRPTTLYLYDYELELKKVLDIGLPIYRIVADDRSDKIYAIVLNPEYAIVEINF